jgi:hypothetical protein
VSVDREIRKRLRQESLLQSALLDLTRLSSTWAVSGPVVHWWHSAPSRAFYDASTALSRDLQKALHRIRREGKE